MTTNQESLCIFADRIRSRQECADVHEVDFLGNTCAYDTRVKLVSLYPEERSHNFPEWRRFANREQSCSGLLDSVRVEARLPGVQGQYALWTGTRSSNSPWPAFVDGIHGEFLVHVRRLIFGGLREGIFSA